MLYLKQLVQGCITLTLSSFIAIPAVVAAAEEVVVYSARKAHLIQPLFDRYTQQTGVKISLLTDKAGPLVQRLLAEGKRTPADLLLTVDAGNLWQAAEKGVLAAVDSELLNRQVPMPLRDPDGHWYGLSKRARTIIYNTDRVNPSEISTYADLAQPKWRGRLCLRTSKKVYNQSLVAMMIARLGEIQTEQIVRGWVANLAAAPFSNDTKTIQAVAAGQCDVAIVNTYYFGRLQRKQSDLPVALAWPTAESGGVHVNVSGGGVTRYAKHPEAALRLLEWLASEEAQGEFAELNLEYPVNPQVSAADQVQAWGEFSEEPINLRQAGRFQARAVRLMDRAGYR
ncbi:MAG: extracellular solute-binding protein [Pseudomonadota bacterium]